MPVANSVKFEQPEKKVYEAIPANVYQVQITDISDKLKAPYGKPFDIPEEEKELFITFEFTILNEGEYRGSKLWKDVRPVTPTPPEGGGFKPSWMHRIVSAIIGHPMPFADAVNWTAEETNGLIGEQLRIVVTRVEKGEKVYNNITEVLPIEKALDPVEVSNETEVAPKSSPEPTSGPTEAPSEPAKGLAGLKQTAEAIKEGKPIPQKQPQDLNVEDIQF